MVTEQHINVCSSAGTGATSQTLYLHVAPFPLPPCLASPAQVEGLQSHAPHQ